MKRSDLQAATLLSRDLDILQQWLDNADDAFLAINNSKLPPLTLHKDELRTLLQAKIQNTSRALEALGVTFEEPLPDRGPPPTPEGAQGSYG